jgi:L-2-hydroxyglutarate oxidase LhgO
VHATLDLTGRVRFGPDVEWLDGAAEPDTLDYTVTASRAAAFYTAIRGYWPELPDGGLQPAYAGVRPKIAHAGQPAADFAIRLSGRPKPPRAVHLLGIESPGLTAALAIGAHVEELLAHG